MNRISRRVKFYITILRILPIFLSIGGCITTSGSPLQVDIKGKDRNVYFPEFRTRIDFPSKEESFQGTRFKRKEIIEPTLALDIGISQGLGTSMQQIGSNEFIKFNGGRFGGPASISSDFRLKTFSAAIDFGLWWYDVVRTELMAGISLVDIDLKLKSNGDLAQDNTFTGGLLLGGQLLYRPKSWLSFYGKVTSTMGIFSILDAGEAGMIVNIFPSIGILGGWRWWNYEEVRGDGESKIDLRLSGPMAGIYLSF